jgi:hypothetical protein
LHSKEIDGSLDMGAKRYSVYQKQTLYTSAFFILAFDEICKKLLVKSNCSLRHGTLTGSHSIQVFKPCNCLL